MDLQLLLLLLSSCHESLEKLSSTAFYESLIPPNCIPSFTFVAYKKEQDGHHCSQERIKNRTMDGHKSLTVLMLFSVHSRGPRCVGYMQRLDRLPQPDKTQTKTPLKPAERWYLARTNDALITEGSLTKRTHNSAFSPEVCISL